MAYVLVAVGALMFVLGLYAAVTGSRIVQVEAGWTSVIAGSMLLVGGVLTMALGLVLRALVQLKASLPPQAAAPVLEPVGAPILTEEPPRMPEAPPQDERVEGDLAAPDLPTAKIHPLRKAKVPKIETDRPHAEDTVAAAVPQAFASAGTPPREPIESEPEPHDQGGALVPEAFQADEEAQPATLDPIESPHPADDYKLETPSTPAHDLSPAPLSPAKEAAEPAAEVDWLDRAFAEIDDETVLQERGRTPAVASHPIAEEQAEDAKKEPVPAEPEPEHAHASAEAALPTAPTLPPAPPLEPTSAVIGRYEADGTSYVMYADGSIEAHSEAGTYRFASMSELKSFIES